jgi:cell division inhibitor SepF
MSLMDKFLNVMRLNDDDEDDYEFDNDDYLDDEAAEDAPAKKSVFKAKEKKEEKYEEPVREKPVKTAPKITPISKGSRKQGNGMEVCVIKPTSVEDAREITETLLNGRTVVLNVEGLNVEIAQRIIDFTSGSCFAISGNLQKISNYIFIITPANVDISGDFQNLVDSFDTTGFSF